MAEVVLPSRTEWPIIFHSFWSDRVFLYTITASTMSTVATIRMISNVSMSKPSSPLWAAAATNVGVGTLVGALVGTTVTGESDGPDDVGTSVGEVVDALGDAVGVAEGCAVGNAVGALVGETDTGAADTGLGVAGTTVNDPVAPSEQNGDDM